MNTQNLEVTNLDYSALIMCNTVPTSASCLKDYIQFLLQPFQQNELGICNDDIKFAFIQSRKNTNLKLSFSANFATQDLSWEIYFNPLYPELAPDIIFDELQFLQNQNIQNFGELSSLEKWDPCNKMSLSKLILELLQLYKQYQEHKLLNFSEKLFEDYNLLVKEFESKNVEVIVNRNLKQTVTVLVRLNIDPSSIRYLEKETKNLNAKLVFYSNSFSWSSEIILSQDLDILYKKTDDTCQLKKLVVTNILEFALELKKFIIEKIKDVLSRKEQRKKFIITFLILYKGLILEYDIIDYEYITVFLENYSIIVNFKLKSKFPEMPFEMHILSSQKRMLNNTHNDFPYSPRWEAEMMIKRAIQDLLENIKKKKIRN